MTDAPQQRRPMGASAWALSEVHPVTLVAMWPGEDAPTKTEVLASLPQFEGAGIAEVEELESTSDDILWNAVLEFPHISSRVILWAEAAKPMPGSGLENTAIGACRWIVGAELALSPEEPLRDFSGAMRLLGGLSDDVPAVLDVNTGQWHMRDSLQLSFLDPGAEPPDEVLWVVHAVTAAEGPAADKVWLYTSGLWRCGRPELEMLEVPRRHVESAVAMLNAVAGIMLETTTPDPGVPFEIGSGLEVTLQPWRDVIAFLDESAHGSMRDRRLEPGHEDDASNPLGGVRAVICGPHPVGAYRPIWTWPREAIERIETEHGTLYQTKSATRRQQRLAQRMLPEFAVALASVQHDGVPLDADGAPGFFAKVGFRVTDDDDADFEHLWFRLTQLDGPRMEGLLLNPPQLLQEMTAGERRWFDQAQVSWWHVAVGEEGFGPESAEAMSRAIDAWRQRRSAS